jgi:hypothetical protein
MQLFQSEIELVLKSGYIYVPLLLDPDIAREVQDRSDTEERLHESAPGKSEPVVEVEGKAFIRSFSFKSVLENYERIDQGTYEQLKRDCLRKCADSPGLATGAPYGKLQTIVLKVMPYFIRKSRGLERRQINDEELLDFIGTKIEVPQRFAEQADRVLDSRPLLQRLDHLSQLEHGVEPPREGRVTGKALRRWLHQALEVQIINRERVHLEQELRERERIGESKRNHIATLLYLAEKGTFELDGFGFSRIGSRDDYLIYKHTGEYVLKDYYDRKYLFPDCRVGISTAGPLRPLVIDSYKHPFLVGNVPRQEICVRGYNWPDKFTAENIIRVLEEGINALLYGYDARRRNGYHSLDPTLYYVKTIEFVDFRI